MVCARINLKGQKCCPKACPASKGRGHVCWIVGMCLESPFWTNRLPTWLQLLLATGLLCRDDPITQVSLW